MAVDVLAHSNVRLNLGRLANYTLATPQAHRIHHSVDQKHYDTNFGNTFLLWDHLFGTFCCDPDNPPTAYGVNEEIPLNFAKQQILPLVWIAKDVLAGFRKLRTSASAPPEAPG